MKQVNPPVAIMINIPEAFFKDHDEMSFRRFYQAMGREPFENAHFNHFISCIPKMEVQHAYVCFKGKVQYKAIVVQYIKDGIPQGLPYAERRDWLVLTGPVVKAPENIEQRGFRGFQYVYEDLF